MYTKLTCLLTCLLLLGLVGSAQADLVSRWTFDEGSGTTVNDVVGTNHGTVSDTPTWIEGVYGGAMEFAGSGSADGSGYRVDCGSDASLDIGNEISLALWIRPDADNPESGMETAPMCKALSSASPSWSFQVRYGWGGPQPYMAFTFNTSPRAWAFVGREMDQGEWHHIACSHDGSTLTCYLNGEETESTAMGAVTNSPAPVLIGSDGWGSDWIGGIDDVRYYDNALTPEEIVAVMMDGAGPEMASDPIPEDEAIDIPRDIALGWTAGKYADTHDVYLGTVFDDVNNGDAGVLVSQGQAGTSYDPDGLLEFGTTYFWRIDEVNAAPDNTVFAGQVWSFTTEPFSYPIETIIATSNAMSNPGEGPENTINGSGLGEGDTHSTAASDMWLGMPTAGPVNIEYEFDRVYKLHELLVWNYNVEFEMVLGFGFKDVTIETSIDGAEWAALGDVTFNQATATKSYTANTTIDMQGVAAKFVRLTANAGFGAIPQFGLSEVRFMYIPAHATKPDPADGAVDVSVNTALTWRAGRDSVSHDVYIGADADSLALAGTVDVASYDPGALDLDTMYVWRVDENQETETWDGSLWSFTTQTYIVVDGFESYTDDEGNRIYETWVDGYGITSNGSTVGHLESPFAEQDIVKSGDQSMPLFYDNVGASMSEAELTLAQDWSASLVKSLTLSFHGDADNTGGQLYVKINGTKIVYDGVAAKIKEASWNLWSIDLAEAGNVSNVTSLIIGIEGAGANGVVYIDDVRLYPEVLAYHRGADVTAPGDAVQGVPNDGVTTGGANNGWPAGESPDLAIDDDTATKFLHFKGNAEPTGIQVTPAAGATIVTGIALTTANDASERDPIAFELSGSNGSINGPYTVIATGDVVDFAGAEEWPRFTKNETLIIFDNDVAYAHYQITFTTVRDAAGANSMQIAEIELIGQ